MAKLGFQEQANPAALARVRVAPSVLLESKVTSVPLNSTITLTTADKWLEIYATEGTLEFVQPSKPTANGQLYDTRVSGFHPGNDTERTKLFNMMYHYRWAVEITDATGKILKAGGDGEWLEASFAFGIAGNMDGQRGTGFTFTGLMTKPAQ